MARTLDGITVLDLSAGPAAALATMFLGDHGARVVRVIGPAASPHRDGGYAVWDRGKECVVLDLDKVALDAPGSLYRRLVTGADVLTDDFAPSAPLQRLTDWQWLAKVNPRLVHCSITAYGKKGPLKDEPAIEDLVLARMGVLGGMPGFRPAPVHIVHPLPTVGAALFADLGIAAALLAREKTGRGRTVETSLMAGALLFHPKVTGEHIEPHVFQTHPSGSAPFYSVYECAGGDYLQLGCVHIGFITVAAKLMNIGDYVAQDRFDGGRGGANPQDVAELRDKLTAVFLTKPRAQWIEKFEAADVPFAPAQLTEEGMADPQVAHNRMAISLDDPALGPLRQMGVPIHFSQTPGQARKPRAAIARATLPDGYPAATDAAHSPPAKADAPPLDGVRILEITNLIAGPTCGRLLADLGADVIKVEPLGGDLSRPIGRTYFYNINFEKRSVSVDARCDAGRKIVQRIAASADAMIANLRPHATERMGIGPTVNPKLIETHVTGYGWTGPYAHRPGIDPLAQALMGMERAQGGPDNPPVFPAQLAPTDYTTGAMGALGTILALFARVRTEMVQRVDSNLLNGAALLSSAWFTQYDGKGARPLADKEQYGLNPFHRLYRLRDGWIYVVAQSDAERAALCRLGGATPQPASGQHPNETPFAAAMAAGFAERELADTLAALRRAGVPCAQAQAGDSELFLDDRHAHENGMVATRQHPTVGELRVAWQYIQFGHTSATQGRPTPLLGQHTDDVLREIGYGADAIAALHADGVVKTETG
jgi:crotonobetainyl-CoA:carnitine CoA-transferase CaiB-like acyl-CoA transferase